MKHGKFATVDTQTGEVLEGAVLGLIFPKRRNGFDGWFAMNQGALKAFRKAGLQGRDYEVLFCILEFLDFENYIRVSKAELARELEMDPSNVGRSMRKLVAIEALLEGPKVGRITTYRLNPSFGWKGSAANHQKALKERMDEKGFSIVE